MYGTNIEYTSSLDNLKAQENPIPLIDGVHKLEIKDGENIGQIDIDSHKIDPFTAEDREMLEWLCAEVAKIM